MLSSDSDAPYDRPNLSKDFLAGSAPAEWLPLRSARFYEKKDIDLHLETTVNRIDTAARMVTTADGMSFPFDRLLLATGAEPVRPPIPGVEQPNVFVLRSWADSRSIVERAEHAKSAVIIGAGFIGLETAAALRERGLEVHVVTPDAIPLEKVVGAELGIFVRSLHERHGVKFHLKDTAARIDDASVTLQGGGVLKADLVIIGVGVKPRISLAKDAGIETGSGTRVNAFLETNVAGIFAAGDVAEWQPVSGGEPRRIEHWVVAERQGQVAAANMLGAGQRFTDAPFFWSAHYDTSIRYVGYAKTWDTVEIDGDIAAGDASVHYKANGRMIAIATIGRDRDALLATAELQGI
jgi:NADPH-dependent 2,4-dienoyl-CoA reductase/sulfur reductase-like enzyme